MRKFEYKFDNKIKKRFMIVIERFMIVILILSVTVPLLSEITGVYSFFQGFNKHSTVDIIVDIIISILVFVMIRILLYRINTGNEILNEFINFSKQEIDKKQNQINELEEKLKESQIDDTQSLKSQIYDLKKQIELISEVQKAQIALANSLQSADDRIKEYNLNAKLIGLAAICLIGFDIYAIVYLWLHYEEFMPLFEKLGAWSLTLFSFPVIVILTIAITLLRHQKKLLDEVRHYSAEKRQIELYSGLLKASQHAAAGLNDPQKSAEYVQETFTAIRNRILSEQPHSNTAASASEKEDYGLEAIVKIIADLAAKNEAKK